MSWLLTYTYRSPPPFGEDTVGARHTLASRLAHERGGIAKPSLALAYLSPSPRKDGILSILRNKHTIEEPHEIHDAQREMAEMSRHSQPPEEPGVPEVDRRFEPE